MRRDAGSHRRKVDLAVQVGGDELGCILSAGRVLVRDDRCGSAVTGGAAAASGLGGKHWPKGRPCAQRAHAAPRRRARTPRHAGCRARCCPLPLRARRRCCSPSRYSITSGSRDASCEGDSTAAAIGRSQSSEPPVRRRREREGRRATCRASAPECRESKQKQPTKKFRRGTLAPANSRWRVAQFQTARCHRLAGQAARARSSPLLPRHGLLSAQAGPCPRARAPGALGERRCGDWQSRRSTLATGQETAIVATRREPRSMQSRNAPLPRQR